MLRYFEWVARANISSFSVWFIATWLLLIFVVRTQLCCKCFQGNHLFAINRGKYMLFQNQWQWRNRTVFNFNCSLPNQERKSLWSLVISSLYPHLNFVTWQPGSSESGKSEDPKIKRVESLADVNWVRRLILTSMTESLLEKSVMLNAD